MAKKIIRVKSVRGKPMSSSTKKPKPPGTAQKKKEGTRFKTKAEYDAMKNGKVDTPASTAPGKVKKPAGGVKFKTNAEYAAMKSGKPAETSTPAKPKSTGNRFKTKAEYAAMRGEKQETQTSSVPPRNNDHPDPSRPQDWEKTDTGYKHTGGSRSARNDDPANLAHKRVRENPLTGKFDIHPPDHSFQHPHTPEAEPEPEKKGIFNHPSKWGRDKGYNIKIGGGKIPAPERKLASFKEKSANSNSPANDNNRKFDFGKYKPTRADRF